jgi:hypothetical protein
MRHAIVQARVGFAMAAQMASIGTSLLIACALMQLAISLRSTVAWKRWIARQIYRLRYGVYPG